ncbi:hypothetical protein [Nostoc sp. LEGE 12450]|uniref:Pepco domain-containing protein n=1 Tax=Nostoc sp. LEGE 12450 TaxID=1828643 RepID=UPI00187F9CA0|nr:hypothetical protein [Nostoc sp. LEGE 12450]MBE8990048.1 hypothetical protein [Nostoc sp. LEGE 12450]
MSEETIWIVTEDIAQATDTQRSYREIAQERGVKVSISELEKNMSRFLESVGRLFCQAEQQTVYSSRMKLDAIVLSVEISAEGEVKLIGTGGKAGGKGAITLQFKRLEDKSLT